MSYLDMAAEVLNSGPINLVNGYWSPAYPALISLAFFIFRPSPMAEFPLIHLVNFLVFVFVLLSFTFFLNSWIVARQAWSFKEEEKYYIIPFSFGLFLWFTMTFITISSVTPDLCVAGIVFLAAGACLRISISGSDWNWYVVLGTILGIGYYVKAVMFPISLILLAVLIVYPPTEDSKRFKAILAGVVFLVVAAPLVALVSSRVGHFSTGETGRLNYAWYVNGLHRHAGWTGGGDDVHGSPEHSPRILLDSPTVLEFANPIKGTYPLWYEPSYWYAGAKVQFDLREQLAALKMNLKEYWQQVKQMSSLFAGAFVLCILTVRQRILPARIDRNCYGLLLWSILAYLMYAFVHVETRFVGAFFVLFWLALYSLMWLRVTAAARGAILATVLCTLFVPTTVDLLAASARMVRGMIRSDQPDHVIIAAALRAAGVERGDRLASVGYSFEAYYARCAGVQVVAEIVDTGALDRLSSSDFAGVKDRLAAIGVKAIVSKERPAGAVSDGWQNIALSGSRQFSILLLNASNQTRK